MVRNILSSPNFESLLLEILSYLNFREKLRYKLVSRQWKTVLDDWILWQQIDIKNDPDLSYRIKDDTVKTWTSTWGPHILELILDGCYWLTDKAICNIAQHCRNLKVLSLNGCTEVSDHGVCEIARSCFKLRVVALQLTRVTERGCQLLADNNPGIEKFRLPTQGNCRQMVSAISGSKCTQVTQLVLKDSIDGERLTLDDDTLRIFAERFPMLEKLHLSWCIHVTDKALREVAEHCTTLRSLSIKECPTIHDDGIRIITERCRSLNDLYIENQESLTNLCCYAIRDNLRHMTSLTLINTSITDVGIEAIVTTNGDSLRSLCFGENSISPQNFKGKCVVPIAKHCKGLKKLHMYSVAMDDVMLLLVCRELHELRDLQLGDCCRVSGTGFTEMTQKCAQLIELRLRDCDTFNDAHLGMVGRKMRQLKYFELLGHHKVTEEAASKFSTLGTGCVVKI